MLRRVVNNDGAWPLRSFLLLDTTNKIYRCVNNYPQYTAFSLNLPFTAQILQKGRNTARCVKYGPLWQLCMWWPYQSSVNCLHQNYDLKSGIHDPEAKASLTCSSVSSLTLTACSDSDVTSQTAKHVLNVINFNFVTSFRLTTEKFYLKLKNVGKRMRTSKPDES